MKHNLTESTIKEALHLRFPDAKYRAENVFAFGMSHETDFLIVAQGSGYVYDIEIKISRGDFFADKKKVDKHSILEFGTFQKSINTGETYIDENGRKHYVRGFETVTHDNYPNRFYYCVPQGMVSVEEVPKYAGLMYVDETGVGIIKAAPLLHKRVLDYEKILCSKFYHRYMSTKAELQAARSVIKGLEEKYAAAKSVLGIIENTPKNIKKPDALNRNCSMCEKPIYGQGQLCRNCEEYRKEKHQV